MPGDFHADCQPARALRDLPQRELCGHDQIPRIAGHREDYLLKALREYKSDKRFGGARQ